jgi:hypothetical protein
MYRVLECRIQLSTAKKVASPGQVRLGKWEMGPIEPDELVTSPAGGTQADGKKRSKGRDPAWPASVQAPAAFPGQSPSLSWVACIVPGVKRSHIIQLPFHPSPHS